MFEIDRKTGRFRWGKYDLRSTMTWNDFRTTYSDLNTCGEHYLTGGVIMRNCQMPTMMIDNHEWFLQIKSVNRYITSLFMYSAELERIEYEEDGDSEWWQKHFEWVQSARKYYREQLGMPNEMQPVTLFDEDEFLSVEQVKLLQRWKYTFRWGSAHITYDTQNTNTWAWIAYNETKQIATWDDLPTECEYRKQSEISFRGQSSANWKPVEQALKLLKGHFAFEEVCPSIFEGGIVFQLKRWSTKVVLDVRLDRLGAKYHISRHDTTRTASVDKDKLLVNELKVFLETEKLS